MYTYSVKTGGKNVLFRKNDRQANCTIPERTSDHPLCGGGEYVPPDTGVAPRLPQPHTGWTSCHMKENTDLVQKQW